MANTIVLHPNGSNTNGGGYDQSTYTGGWNDWHTSFGPKLSVTGCTYDPANPAVLTKTGAFAPAGAYVGIYAFVATYDVQGHFLVVANTANTVILGTSGLGSTPTNNAGLPSVGH
jgi:hypothetical protein